MRLETCGPNARPVFTSPNALKACVRFDGERVSDPVIDLWRQVRAELTQRRAGRRGDRLHQVVHVPRER